MDVGSHCDAAAVTLVADKTLSRIWQALPAQLGTVVGEEAKLAAPALARAWTPSAGRYFARLELVEPHVCVLYMVFELPLAIACAGRLMVRPPAAIRKNIAAATFDGDDLDAMGECINTFCSAINEAVRAERGDEYRIVFRSGSVEPPDVAELGEHSVAGGRLDFGDLSHGELQLVIPDAVFVAVHGPDAAAPAADGRDDASPGPRDADDDDDDDRPSTAAKGEPLLTSEELAAIREATRMIGRAPTVIVAELQDARATWENSMQGAGIEFVMASSYHQVLALCRQAPIGVVVVDADACASGGLGMLAAIRGQLGASCRRVVVASQPTQRHLVACLGAGASDYLCRPLDLEALARIVAAAA